MQTTLSKMVQNGEKWSKQDFERLKIAFLDLKNANISECKFFLEEQCQVKVWVHKVLGGGVVV